MESPGLVRSPRAVGVLDSWFTIKRRSDVVRCGEVRTISGIHHTTAADKSQLRTLRTRQCIGQVVSGGQVNRGAAGARSLRPRVSNVVINSRRVHIIGFCHRCMLRGFFRRRRPPRRTASLYIRGSGVEDKSGRSGQPTSSHCRAEKRLVVGTANMFVLTA